MATEVIPQVWTRQLPTVAPNGQYSLGMGTRGALHTTRVEPEYANYSLSGSTYCLSAGVIANAQAPIQQIPTTSATWGLYNGNTVTGGGYCLVPLKIGVWVASATTTSVGGSLLIGLSTAVQSAAVNNATGIVGPKSGSASTARTSNATLGVSVTLAGAPAWVPIANFGNHAATAKPGSGVVADLKGICIVPPHYCLGIEVFTGLGGSSDALYAVSVIYAEVPCYTA